METKLKELKTILGEVNDLNAAAALLEWDQQTYMPSEGAVARGRQLATLSSIAHDKFTSPEVGRLLEEVQPAIDQIDPDSDDARLVRVTRREYRKAACVPSELVAELARETTMAFSVWQEARAENNFAKSVRCDFLLVLQERSMLSLLNTLNYSA